MTFLNGSFQKKKLDELEINLVFSYKLGGSSSSGAALEAGKDFTILFSFLEGRIDYTASITLAPAPSSEEK